MTTDIVRDDRREKLPARRRSVTFDIEFPRFTGRRIPVTAGFYEDGRVGEVFIDVRERVGTDGDKMARDVGLNISIALQYGAPLDVLAGSHPKSEAGEPDSLAGMVVAALVEAQRVAMEEVA